MLFNKDSTIQSTSRRFCVDYKSENSIPCQPSGRRVIPSGRLAVQSSNRPDDVSNRPDAHKTKASSVQTTWIFVRTFLCVEKLRTAPAYIRSDVSVVLSDDSQCSTKLQISFQNQIWEDCCKRPDDVDSPPDALLLKASSQFKLNRLDASLPWYGRAFIKYGNYVHQISRPDDHQPGPDTRNLYKEITWSGRATVGRQCLTVWTRLSNRKDL
jgi:hypothetical protein